MTVRKLLLEALQAGEACGWPYEDPDEGFDAFSFDNGGPPVGVPKVEGDRIQASSNFGEFFSLWSSFARQQQIRRVVEDAQVPLPSNNFVEIAVCGFEEPSASLTL